MNPENFTRYTVSPFQFTGDGVMYSDAAMLPPWMRAPEIFSAAMLPLFIQTRSCCMAMPALAPIDAAETPPVAMSQPSPLSEIHELAGTSIAARPYAATKLFVPLNVTSAKRPSSTASGGRDAPVASSQRLEKATWNWVPFNVQSTWPAVFVPESVQPLVMTRFDVVGSIVQPLPLSIDTSTPSTSTPYAAGMSMKSWLPSLFTRMQRDVPDPSRNR